MQLNIAKFLLGENKRLKNLTAQTRFYIHSSSKKRPSWRENKTIWLNVASKRPIYITHAPSTNYRVIYQLSRRLRCPYPPARLCACKGSRSRHFPRDEDDFGGSYAVHTKHFLIKTWTNDDLKPLVFFQKSRFKSSIPFIYFYYLYYFIK